MFEDTLLRKYFYIAFVVLAYWATSITTVFVNKILLSDESVGLNAPMFITWFQCVVTYVTCVILSFTKGFNGLVYFPEGTPWKWTTIKAVIPLSIIFTAMIATNNLCLLHVSTAFYYISRSMVTVFNVILTWVILGDKTDFRCIVCCGLMVFGYLLGVDQESLFDSFSLIGTVYGVTSALMVALYTIFTKRVLPSVQNEVCLLSYYNNAYSVIIFLFLMAVNGEFPVVYNYPHLSSVTFWVEMTGSGLCGFTIGFVMSMQIKVTSPVTHTVSSISKSCLQTFIAVYWWNEAKSGLWWFANVFVLFASAMYARFRQLIIQREHTAKQQIPLKQ